MVTPTQVAPQALRQAHRIAARITRQAVARIVPREALTAPQARREARIVQAPQARREVRIVQAPRQPTTTSATPRVATREAVVVVVPWLWL